MSRCTTLREFEHDMFTFQGLHKWYKRMVEKFGWIVIAAQQGRLEDVELYEAKLMKLVKTLHYAMGVYQEADRQHDIAVMARHIDMLLINAKALLSDASTD